MQKTVMFAAGFVLIILSLSVAYAAGVSTNGGDSSNASATNNSVRQAPATCEGTFNGACMIRSRCILDGGKVVPIDSVSCNAVSEVCCQLNKTRQAPVNPRALCEQKAARTERIKCRLELQRNVSVYEELNISEESCRNVRNQSACNQLYAQVRACYDREGRQKELCFKRIAGVRNDIKDETNPSVRRSYMVFVLYNLQERVEERHESGNITAEQAAQLIDKIVDLKQRTLNGASKAELQREMQKFRSLWQTIMR